jgi:hypothetical protein
MASSARQPFEPPCLKRVGSLKEITQAFNGNGTDSFIVGQSRN